MLPYESGAFRVLRRYVNTTENAYILIEYSYTSLLCHHDKPEPSLLQVYIFLLWPHSPA